MEIVFVGPGVGEVVVSPKSDDAGAVEFEDTDVGEDVEFADTDIHVDVT